MKHLGDITKIKGAEIEPVDILVGGSPCQDLSVAGLRKGLEGERSGLFLEQIRIIREMREYERNVRKRPNQLVRPRWCIWENVPGALSSGTPKGEDFRIVIEEFCKIADLEVHVPRPEKWEPSGTVVGDGWSLAWTTHNAADWCVPQRRKRISVVVDYNTERAAEILFECEGLSGNSEPRGKARERTAGEIESGTGAASCTLKIRGGTERDSGGRKAGKGPLIQYEQSATLGVSQDQTLFVLNEPISYDDKWGGATYIRENMANTLAARDAKQPQAVCYEISPNERERERERSRR